MQDMSSVDVVTCGDWQLFLVLMMS